MSACPYVWDTFLPLIIHNKVLFQDQELDLSVSPFLIMAGWFGISREGCTVIC